VAELAEMLRTTFPRMFRSDGEALRFVTDQTLTFCD
jgi:hypothetical protein